MKILSSHLSIQKLIFFKERERRGSIGIPSNQMEARNKMKILSSHLSNQKLIFFKERDRRGSTRRDSIQPDGRKQDTR
jgi:hypothetical protein